MPKDKIIIGTRSSKLALWQADFVKSAIEKISDTLSVELKLVKTKGDKILDTALSKIGDKGLFTKELENELLNGSIDLAVHSLKDLQTDIPQGLKLAAVTKRHAVEDVLIAREKGIEVKDLKPSANIATGSLRRRAQLLHFCSDFVIHDLRGNVNTRIDKFLKSNWDAIILARAGVERLGLNEYISSVIDTDIILPAVGQGVLGIETADNNNLDEIMNQLIHEDTFLSIRAERAFLKALGGGCQTPIAAHAEVRASEIDIKGLVCSLDGKAIFNNEISGKKDSPEAIGKELAEILISKGAYKYLDNN